MGKRILSTLILWTITVVCFFVIGPDAAVWLLACLSVATQYEFYGLLERMGRHPFKKFGALLRKQALRQPYSGGNPVGDHRGHDSGLLRPDFSRA